MFSRNFLARSNLFGAKTVAGDEGEKNAIFSPLFKLGGNKVFITFLFC
ncbi:hypothetical protein VIBNIAM115_1860003 [Vibrio nigripulchritudo AM115]|nr:hypothetical protein VIBNIAM115_1860003 [Vibrio nigripulchritudo AM115]